MTHTHTPGPWSQLGCEIYAGEIPIAGIIGITWDRMVENQANLNLISAAPELLAALNESLNYVVLRGAGMDLSRDALNKLCAEIRAAISKAEGNA
jgi:hypothetical protein